MPLTYMTCTLDRVGVQWLSGRVLDSRPRPSCKRSVAFVHSTHHTKISNHVETD